MTAVARTTFGATIRRLLGRRSAADRKWRVDVSGEVLRLSGVLRTRDAESLCGAIRQVTGGAKVSVFDIEGVTHIDGGVVALMRSVCVARGAQPEVRGGDRFRPLFEIYGGEHLPAPRRPREGVAAEVGRAAIHEIADIQRVMTFTGELTVASGRIIRDLRRCHWGEIPLLVERAGADAIPVVLVINFLIGFVMAYMAAHALEMFGATFYVANLVAIAVTRQLGPLMTAIVVCGRSGAGFTSELGSMTVSEEIAALRTLGLGPYGWLVIPRVTALVLVLPILTLIADLVGISGGLFVAVTSLDMSVPGYINATRDVLRPWDVGSGILMSFAFAIAIALIACQEGFAALGGAAGVGRRTTATVVSSLFAIVVLDTIFTLFYRVLGLS